MSETDLVTTGTAPEAGAPDTPGGTAAPTRRRGLSTMVLAELRQLAGELNIADTAKMRKGDLIAAIKERQAGGPASQLSLPTPPATSTNGDGTAAASTMDEAPAPARRRRVASRAAGSPRKGAATADGGVPATTDEASAAPLEVPAAEAAPPAQPVPEVRAPEVRGAPEVTAPEVTAPEVTAPEQPAEAPAAPPAVETDGETTPRRSRQRRARGDRADRPDQGENGASVATPTIDVAPETTPEAAGEGGRRDGGRENGARENGRSRGPRTDRTDDRGPRTDRNDRNDDRGGRPDERNQRDDPRLPRLPRLPRRRR